MDFQYGQDYPDEPWVDRDGRPIDDEHGGAEPTTWEALDLGPWLRGEVEEPKPSLGIARTDGLRLIYPGREHAILGETESGKSWLSSACAAAELEAGNPVVYIHYEEGDPASTIERLRLFSVGDEAIAQQLRFAGPSRPIQEGWLDVLLAKPTPTLVIHDGVNEAMALHGHDMMSAEGAALFRRWLVRPCVQIGAATIACDHLPKVRDGTSRDAYGSVHKGNALDGARFVLENAEPFGRGLRGASHVFVTKDRPGHLRAHGHPTKLAGKTFLGTLVVDDSKTPYEPLSAMLYAPKRADAGPAVTVTTEHLADLMWDVVAALPDRSVESARKLHAEMRVAGHKFRKSAFEAAADVLVVTGRFSETPGERGAIGYHAVSTASQDENS
jgi:hypothetical protein